MRWEGNARPNLAKGRGHQVLFAVLLFWVVVRLCTQWALGSLRFLPSQLLPLEFLQPLQKISCHYNL